MPRGLHAADADPPGPSLTAHGRGIPSPRLGNQRHLRAVAGPPGEFVTALPCHRSCMGRLELFSVTSRDRLAAVRLPFPSFRRHGRSGFPVRVGCSRTVMVPRWVLVPLVFQRPSFEDRLSSLDLRSFLRPNASSKPSQQTAVCWRQGISQGITLRSRRTVVRGAGQSFLANQVGWQPVPFVSPPKRLVERAVGVAV